MPKRRQTVYEHLAAAQASIGNAACAWADERDSYDLTDVCRRRYPQWDDGLIQHLVDELEDVIELAGEQNRESA